MAGRRASGLYRDRPRHDRAATKRTTSTKTSRRTLRRRRGRRDQGRLASLPRTLRAVARDLRRDRAAGSRPPRLLSSARVLYKRSARGTAPAFIADYLDHGKPEQIVRLGRQNRFKSDVPGVIRPDLILDRGRVFAAELDSVPGGMGFVGAMARSVLRTRLRYASAASIGMPDGFAARCSRRSPASSSPSWRSSSRDESADYRAELDWLARAMTALGIATFVCAPQEIVFTEDALFVRLDGRPRREGRRALSQLRTVRSAQRPEARADALRGASQPREDDAAAEGHLEEKLSFALLHHPTLAQTVAQGTRRRTFERLRAIFPQTWVLDPRPLPPQAVIAGLTRRRASRCTTGCSWSARQERARLRRQAVRLLRTGVGLARRQGRQRPDQGRLGGGARRRARVVRHDARTSCSVS